MSGWVKTVAGSLCILTILLHLVPGGSFEKYVRFYAGLLFLLIAAGPVLQIFGGEEKLERLLQLEFLKEEYYDLETAVSGMEELKNDRIKDAYHQELTRQIREILSAWGLGGARVELEFDRQEEYALQGITVALTSGEGTEEEIEAARREISEVYMVNPDRVTILFPG